MLDKIIKKYIRIIGVNRFRKYKFTDDGLRHFITLKPNSQQLLYTMLNHVKYSEATFTMTYQEAGYDNRTFFYRYRKELLDKQFIFADGDEYYINPAYIDCMSKKLREQLFVKYGNTKVFLLKRWQVPK